MDSLTPNPAALIETERLCLAELTESPSDIAFIRRLVNDPDWLRYIGDKNVHSDEDALRYLRNGPLAMYAKHGVGLWRVALKAERPGSDAIPIGMCGLIKREGLDDLDLGFAFLPDYRAQGYAAEASRAVLGWGRERGVATVVAITTFDNTASGALLSRLSFSRDGEVKLPNSEEALFKYRLDLAEWQP
ncbi:MAG: GNAT family N-acetyltransferase [Burkholderiales bacterium]|nr:GNAT family N-acetyltransferase [Burkholderiales bacterium]